AVRAKEHVLLTTERVARRGVDALREPHFHFDEARARLVGGAQHVRVGETCVVVVGRREHLREGVVERAHASTRSTSATKRAPTFGCTMSTHAAKPRKYAACSDGSSWPARCASAASPFRRTFSIIAR